MWQQSHGRWTSLMRRKVCLTNYPGGQTTCFSNATFLCLLSLTQVIFSPRFLGTRAEPWHLMLIFAFELALWIAMYWLPAITFLCLLVERLLLLFMESFLTFPMFPFSFFFLSFIELQILAWTDFAHCDLGSDRRRVMDKPLFDMKSIICKVDQITHKCINQTRVIDFYGTGL